MKAHWEDLEDAMIEAERMQEQCSAVHDAKGYYYYRMIAQDIQRMADAAGVTLLNLDDVRWLEERWQG